MASFDYSTPFAPMQAPAARPDPISSALDTIIEQKRQERAIQAQRDLETQRASTEWARDRQRAAEASQLEQYKTDAAITARRAQIEDANFENKLNVLAKADSEGKSPAEIESLAQMLGIATRRGGPAVAAPVLGASPALPSGPPPQVDDTGVPVSKITENDALKLVGLGDPNIPGPTEEGAQPPTAGPPEAGAPSMRASVAAPVPGASAGAMGTPGPGAAATAAPVPGVGVLRFSGPGGRELAVNLGGLSKEAEDYARARMKVKYDEYVARINADKLLSQKDKEFQNTAAAIVFNGTPNEKNFSERVDKTAAQLRDSANKDARTRIAVSVGGLGKNEQFDARAESLAAGQSESWWRGVGASKNISTTQNLNMLQDQIDKISNDNISADQKTQLIAAATLRAAKTIVEENKMSDKDVAEAKGKPSVVTRFKNLIASAQGEMSPEAISSARMIIDTLRESNHRSSLANSVSFHKRFLSEDAMKTFSGRRAAQTYLNTLEEFMSLTGVTEEQIQRELNRTKKAHGGAPGAPASSAGVPAAGAGKAINVFDINSL